MSYLIMDIETSPRQGLDEVVEAEVAKMIKETGEAA